MTSDDVTRAHWGDLTGLSLAGLVRLSFESDAETGRGVGHVPYSGRDIKGRAEQEKDCRAYVESRGGRYVHTYGEPDTSAWKRKRVRLADGRQVYSVVRPVFEGALEDLKRGATRDGAKLDGLVVYDIDRLTRDHRHLEDAIDVVEHHRRPIVDITGTLDLLTDNGRTVARTVVATKSQQSADTARRVKRKHQAMALAGIPAGGTLPFGWLADRRSLDPVAAERIREGAQRLLRGVPLRAVVLDWNERGVLPRSGRPWSLQTVKSVYRSPRVCGLRPRYLRQPDESTGKEHWSVEVVRDDAGRPVMGQWEPILTVAEWEAVTAVIGANAVPGRGSNSRKYLLTGTMRCGKDGCGGPMRALKADPRRNSTPGAFYYSCRTKEQGGCGGGTSIHGQNTDLFVTELVIAKYEAEARRRNVATESGAWERQDDLDRVQQDIRELTAAWRSRKISGSRYFALLPELEDEEKTLAGEREGWLAARHSTLAKPASIRTDWPGYSLPEKRAYIEEVLAAVIVHPWNGRRGWNPDRLEPVWRDE